MAGHIVFVVAVLDVFLIVAVDGMVRLREDRRDEREQMARSIAKSPANQRKKWQHDETERDTHTTSLIHAETQLSKPTFRSILTPSDILRSRLKFRRVLFTITMQNRRTMATVAEKVLPNATFCDRRTNETSSEATDHGKQCSAGWQRRRYTFEDGVRRRCATVLSSS